MEYTIRDLANTIIRHTRALIAFWAVALVVVLIFYSQTRKLYESKAKILVSLGSESQGKAVYLNEKNLQVLQREQQIHDEQQILESHEVLLTTAKWILGEATPGSPAPVRDFRVDEAKRFITGEEPEPTLLLRSMHAVMQLLGKIHSKKSTHDQELEDMVRELSKDLSVNLIFDSDALDVSFRYRDSRVAQTILSLIVASYFDHHIEVFQSGAEAKLLKSQYDHSVKQYRDRLAEFSSYMTTHGVYADDTQMNTLMEQREKLLQALNQALVDEASDQARLASLTAVGQSLQHFEKYSTIEVRNKGRDELLSKLHQATLEQTALLARHPKGSRAYQEEESKLEEIQNLVNQEPATVTDQTEQRRTKASELVEAEVISATEARRGDQARIGQLRDDLKKTEVNLNQFASGLQGFDALKLDLALAKEESEQMAKAYVDSHLKSLTSQNAITDVSLIDGPTWDWHPASPKKEIVVAASLALLLVGSFAILIAAVALDETVSDPRTAKSRLGVDVVGTFPISREPSEYESEIIQRFEEQDHAEFARIYHAIRKRGPEGQVIVIAETNSGDGAGVIGFGLAKFISTHAREKTAFIDRTDHQTSGMFGTDKAGAHLSVIARSESTDDALLLLNKLRQEYTSIVMASGAVKDATDLLAISGVAPVTFLVIEAGKTRQATARFSIEMLQRYGFHDVGVILNRRKLYIPNWLMRFV